MEVGRTTTADESLAQTVRRAQQLEPAAFDELVDRYASRLYGLLYRLTGRRDDAEELVQEVYVRLVRMLPSYQDEGRFEAWLFRIAANLARDAVRRRRFEPRQAAFTTNDADVQGNAESGPSCEARQPPPEARLRLSEDADELQRSIARLSDTEREVILLRHYGEMSYAEIAAAMGTPLGTALARAPPSAWQAKGMDDNTMKPVDDEMLRIELADGERWFQAVMRDETPFETERLKRQVRLLVNEAWLATQLEGNAPSEVQSRARFAVAEALARTSAEIVGPARPNASRPTSLIRLFAPLGAIAAAIVFTTSLPSPMAPQTTGAEFVEVADTSVAADELAEIVGVLETELAELEDDLDELSVDGIDSFFLREVEDLSGEGALDADSLDGESKGRRPAPQAVPIAHRRST